MREALTGLDAHYNLTVVYRDEIIELFERAATDREHGAVEIERTLIRGLLDLDDRLRLDSLSRGLTMLAEGQPAMANLRAMAAWMAAVESPASCVARLERRAAVLEELPDRLAANAWPLVKGSRSVVTISRSSAVAAVVQGAWRRGWEGSVVVLDGTASGHGAEQAQRLAAIGDAVSRTDDSASLHLKAGVVVVVGADAVGRRSFINSVGTARLLELACERKVERVLVADSGKDVEDHVAEEIIQRSPRHRETSGEEWPVFEIIPMSLVCARVTE